MCSDFMLCVTCISSSVSVDFCNFEQHYAWGYTLFASRKFTHMSVKMWLYDRNCTSTENCYAYLQGFSPRSMQLGCDECGYIVHQSYWRNMNYIKCNCNCKYTDLYSVASSKLLLGCFTRLLYIKGKSQNIKYKKEIKVQNLML